MKTITTEELSARKKRHDDFLLINTLPNEYFSETHIPDSINIPESREDFVALVQQAAGDKRRTIILYCANEDCASSTNAARKLDEAGFKSVYDYEGGAAGWRDAGERLQTHAVP